MRKINNGWVFTPVWDDAFMRGEGTGEAVRLPHTVRELPLHHIDPMDYQMVCGYRRVLDIPKEAEGQRVLVRLDGAAHIATLFVNGREAAVHRCGYTAFEAEITPFVRFGQSNLLAVRLDTTENPAVPPFGFVIDYLTFGGLYRDAWLDVRPACYIDDVFAYAKTLTTACVAVHVNGDARGRVAVRVVEESTGVVVGQAEAEAARDVALTLSCPQARAWSPETPCLYRAEAELLSPSGEAGDTAQALFGFRTCEFAADGFYLNGKKTFLRGLNRHQCYPYVGYAVPDRLQREDARILKHELQVTAVRTSHYPQSHAFLDQCDREGLLVFTEIPGWQHIGDENWKAQAVQNTCDMVRQYRNHPSIVLWGVRINESLDDDAFYEKTNAAARALDPSRATSGVRYFEKSSLKEDVYAYNDFSHTGQNAGCRKKRAVMKERGRPLLISEHNGHMFPVKPFDPWRLRQAQALRHARVLNDAMADGEHAGCFGWCMFDYPTHQDFGSGDRVCYHGVMDAFRNPKPAAALYQSQGEDAPVLSVASPMDIGDYPGEGMDAPAIFTNADAVALYKNDDYVTTFRTSAFSALPHGPLSADDLVGELLEKKEGYGKKKAAAVLRALRGVAKHGPASMTLPDKLRMAWCMLRYRLTYQDGVRLFGAYMGNWGGKATRWRFDAIKDGRVVRSVVKTPSARLHLAAAPSHLQLTEGDTYDMAAVRIQVLDENGNPASYAQLPVKLTLTGPLALVGPDVITLEGGMGGAYVRTVGQTGQAALTLTTAQTEPVTLHFDIGRQAP